MIIVKDKEFTLPPLTVVQGEKGTVTLEFQIQDTLPVGVSLFLIFCNAEDICHKEPMTQGASLTWTVSADFTAAAGMEHVQILAEKEGFRWLTKIARLNILEAISGNN